MVRRMKWLGGLIFNDRRRQFAGWRRPPLPLSPEVVMIGKPSERLIEQHSNPKTDPGGRPAVFLAPIVAAPGA